MHKQLAISLDTPFKQEVFEGLTSYPKFLSSKYIYDKAGDKLFQDIMNMPEYYLTNTEYAIIEQHKIQLAHMFSCGNLPFHLIEMGAGDGKKTKILLRHFTQQNLDFTFRPIDISQNALDQLQINLKREIPRLRTEPLQGNYFETLRKLNFNTEERKVILFLGSNIGNLCHEEAIDFLSQIQEYMQPEDLLFIGFDQKKNPETILNAYNDETGITAKFNKNLLVRINKELDANFNIDCFKHWEVYDPETGTAKSYLVAKSPQKVFIQALDLHISFKAWETIHTEISQKYDDRTVQWLAEQSNLTVIDEYSDPKQFYKNYLFKKSY
ncbi:L-histidine N(alpha)-methyltransferase [Maribacter sp. MAR_2009_72]|uniref:L-histidine N(alpha)-methyltransferase n=1 Tax=Maribacter sp. MAR_2009_72 TaxID=1250050 RepID=UPI0011992016|nr:L-histidine N(alpha)-methyltransferase [Maribacter sp. MAR_2009_72]TVZ15360.1 dimethylhistidine N-methyltransferase [Maribacter sp. MAR_2009_72]